MSDSATAAEPCKHWVLAKVTTADHNGQVVQEIVVPRTRRSRAFPRGPLTRGRRLGQATVVTEAYAGMDMFIAVVVQVAGSVHRIHPVRRLDREVVKFTVLNPKSVRHSLVSCAPTLETKRTAATKRRGSRASKRSLTVRSADMGRVSRNRRQTKRARHHHRDVSCDEAEPTSPRACRDPVSPSVDATHDWATGFAPSVAAITPSHSVPSDVSELESLCLSLFDDEFVLDEDFPALGPVNTPVALNQLLFVESQPVLLATDSEDESVISGSDSVCSARSFDFRHSSISLSC